MTNTARNLASIGEPVYTLRGEPGMTLGEMVRKTLAALIVAGEFPEDHRLYPEQLAEKLGVSITPVREALMRLANDGFIENVQRRGFHIRAPGANQVRDMWQVRQSLELTAGELVIARIRSGELRVENLFPMRDLQRAQEGDPSSMDHATKLDLNGQFHSVIVDLSGNALLKTMHESLRHRVLGALVQRGTDAWRRRIAVESKEHWTIIDALTNLDAEAYQAAVRAHLSRSLKDALADVGEQRT